MIGSGFGIIWAASRKCRWYGVKPVGVCHRCRMQDGLLHACNQYDATQEHTL